MLLSWWCLFKIEKENLATTQCNLMVQSRPFSTHLSCHQTVPFEIWRSFFTYFEMVDKMLKQYQNACSAHDMIKVKGEILNDKEVCSTIFSWRKCANLKKI